MKNSRRKLIVLITIVILTLGVGITYSLFTSGTFVTIPDQNIAKFIFNAEMLDNINLPIIDLKPGDKKEYLFSVSNNEDGKVSEVTISYQIIIKTFHVVPLDIKLYKLNGINEDLLVNCDETFSRSEINKELICNSDFQFMTYTNAKLDDYKLVIEFPENYSDISYSELVDYIDLEVKSSQKS